MQALGNAFPLLWPMIPAAKLSKKNQIRDGILISKEYSGFEVFYFLWHLQDTLNLEAL